MVYLTDAAADGVCRRERGEFLAINKLVYVIHRTYPRLPPPYEVKSVSRLRPLPLQFGCTFPKGIILELHAYHSPTHMAGS